MGTINPIPHPIMADLQRRVGRLEDNVQEAREEAHERSTQVAVMAKDVAYIKEEVVGMKKGFNKVIFTIIGAVLTPGIGLVTTFFVSGGLDLLK